jgi:hypothetical protein
MPTREEIEALIMTHATFVPYSGYVEIKRETLGQILALARLGAKVAAPSEAEIESIARGICKYHADAMGPEWGVTFADYWANNKANWHEDACAALQALKDSQ